MSSTSETRRKGAPARSLPRRPMVWLALAGIAALAVIAVIATAGEPETEQPDAEVAAPTLSGEALPAFTPGGPDPAMGMPAPVAEGSDFSGEPVTIGGGGEPQAVVFLAHWCPHCQAEVPAVQSWLDEQGAPDGVELASVSTSSDASLANYPPQAWLEREGWTPPVLVDSDQDRVASAYGLSGFPFWTFIDADGVVVGRTSGELDIDTLERTLDELAG